MSRVKEEVIAMVQALPDDCTLEDIQYHLYVREKIARGQRAIAEGNVVSEEEAKKRVYEWLGSFGPSQP